MARPLTSPGHRTAHQRNAKAADRRLRHQNRIQIQLQRFGAGGARKQQSGQQPPEQQPQHDSQSGEAEQSAQKANEQGALSDPNLEQPLQDLMLPPQPDDAGLIHQQQRHQQRQSAQSADVEQNRACQPEACHLRIHIVHLPRRRQVQLNIGQPGREARHDPLQRFDQTQIPVLGANEDGLQRRGFAQERHAVGQIDEQRGRRARERALLGDRSDGDILPSQAQRLADARARHSIGNRAIQGEARGLALALSGRQLEPGQPVGRDDPGAVRQRAFEHRHHVAHPGQLTIPPASPQLGVARHRQLCPRGHMRGALQMRWPQVIQRAVDLHPQQVDARDRRHAKHDAQQHAEARELGSPHEPRKAAHQQGGHASSSTASVRAAISGL